MEDKQRIKIMTPLSANDKVEFLQSYEEQLTQRFGFRQSQRYIEPVLTRDYDSNKYKLAQDSNWWDTRVELVDASNLP